MVPKKPSASPLLALALTASLLAAGCGKKGSAQPSWTTRPIPVAARTVGGATFEAGVPEGLVEDALIKLDTSIAFHEPGRLLDGVRVTYTVIADVAPRTPEEAVVAADPLAEGKVLRAGVDEGRLVVVATNERRSALSVDAWTRLSATRTLRCTASIDERDVPLADFTPLQAWLTAICASVKVPALAPGEGSPPPAFSAARADAGPPPELPPEVRAFVDALGDETKNTAAFKGFAKVGVTDDHLASYAYQAVTVEAATPDGKAICYRLLGKVPVGAHVFDVCFEGGKILRVTHRGVR